MAENNSEEEEKYKAQTIEAVGKWKSKRGSLIMALHEIQGVFGYIPWASARTVADEMGVPLARIYEVLTFYNYFKIEKPGKNIISVCDGTACHLKGSQSVLKAYQDELGIGAGETTPDGLFHLQIVRCLGCCGLSPVSVVNGKTYSRVTPGDVKNIIAEWRAKETENNAESK
jgi:NADH-quinone oxidoreductase subunit E